MLVPHARTVLFVGFSTGGDPCSENRRAWWILRRIGSHTAALDAEERDGEWDPQVVAE